MNDSHIAATTTSEAHAAVIVSVLESEGITCRLIRGDPLSPRVLDVGRQTPFIVEVHKQDAERARRVLKERREEFADSDWDSIELGAPANLLASQLSRTNSPTPHVADGPDRLIQIVTWLIVTVVIASAIVVVVALMV